MSSVLPRRDVMDRKQVKEAARGHKLVEYMTKNIHEGDWNTITCDKRQYSLLHYAAFYNDIAAIVFLMKHGADVNISTEYDSTPTKLALVQCREMALEVLLSQNATVYERDVSTMLELEISDSDEDMERYGCCEILLKNGYSFTNLLDPYDDTNNDYQKFVYQAKIYRDNCKKVVIALLGIKKRRPAFFARHDRFLIRELALEIWRTRGQEDWLPNSEFTARLDAHLNILDETQVTDDDIFSAAEKSELLDYIESHIQKKYWNSFYITKDRWRLIHFAALFGDVKVTVALFEQGCDMNVKTRDGKTPKSIAMDNDHFDELECLIACGATISSQDVHNLLRMDNIDQDLEFEDWMDVIYCRNTSIMILLQNGVQIDPCLDLKDRPETEIFSIQKYRKACQALIVTILGLKKKHQVFRQLSPSIIEKLCVEIWTTRSSDEWIPEIDQPSKREKSIKLN